MLETLRRRNLFAVLALPGTVHQCGTSLALTLSRVGLVVSEHAWWAKSEPKANRDKRNVRESLPLSPFPPPSPPHSPSLVFARWPLIPPYPLLGNLSTSCPLICIAISENLGTLCTLQVTPKMSFPREWCCSALFLPQ